MEIKFVVPGDPQGKARARTFYDPRACHSVSKTPENTAMYENLIKTAYTLKYKDFQFPEETPLQMEIVAYFRIVKSERKWKRSLMEAGLMRPMKTPDADNIQKVICDALNKVAYHDDAAIVRATVDKVYTSGPPRVDVTIREWKGPKDE